MTCVVRQVLARTRGKRKRNLQTEEIPVQALQLELQLLSEEVWVKMSVGVLGCFSRVRLSSVHVISQNTRVGCHALLQGIVLIQGSNPCLLHCRRQKEQERPNRAK